MSFCRTRQFRSILGLHLDDVAIDVCVLHTSANTAQKPVCNFRVCTYSKLIAEENLAKYFLNRSGLNIVR